MIENDKINKEFKRNYATNKRKYNTEALVHRMLESINICNTLLLMTFIIKHQNIIKGEIKDKTNDDEIISTVIEYIFNVDNNHFVDLNNNKPTYKQIIENLDQNKDNKTYKLYYLSLEDLLENKNITDELTKKVEKAPFNYSIKNQETFSKLFAPFKGCFITFGDNYTDITQQYKTSFSDKKDNTFICRFIQILFSKENINMNKINVNVIRPNRKLTYLKDCEVDYMKIKNLTDNNRNTLEGQSNPVLNLVKRLEDSIKITYKNALLGFSNLQTILPVKEEPKK